MGITLKERERERERERKKEREREREREKERNPFWHYCECVDCIFFVMSLVGVLRFIKHNLN